MNRNIEVITPDLWAVHKEYIQAGYIRELRHIQNTRLEQINLSNTGIIILDKGSKHYSILKKMFPAAMKMNQADLEGVIEKYGDMQNLNPVTDEWVNVVGWEIKRRCIRAEYLKSIPRPHMER